MLLEEARTLIADLGTVTPGKPVRILRRFLKFYCCSILHGHDLKLYLQCGLYKQRLNDCAGYVTTRQSEKIFNIINPVEKRAVLDDKLLFHEHCRKHAIPTPDILALFGSRTITDRYNHCLDSLICRHTIEEAFSFLENLPPGTTVILKRLTGLGGEGITALTRSANGLSDPDNQDLGPEDFKRRICNHEALAAGILVQKRVFPHEQLAAIMAKDCMGTVRIVSARFMDRILIPYSLIKLPCGKVIHDNFSKGESGNYIAPVDPATGRIGRVWRKVEKSSHLMSASDVHPVTGARVAGMVVPGWRSVLDAVRHAAKSMPLNVIGWDVAITNQGISILEANARPSPDLVQISLQRGIRPELETLTTLNSFCV